MRRPCADREEKRVAYGRDMYAEAFAMRYVTEVRTVPMSRKPDGEHAMSSAERQARYRARHSTRPASIPARPHCPADRRGRRRDAVTELLTLQAEYADWLAALPDSLHDSPTAEALEAITDLDLTTLADAEMPRGYGRD